MKIKRTEVRHDKSKLFTKELEHMKNRMILLSSIYKFSGKEEDRVEYKKARKTYKDSLIETKKQRNAIFIESSNNKCRAAWNLIKTECNKGVKNQNIPIEPNEMNSYRESCGNLKFRAMAILTKLGVRRAYYIASLVRKTSWESTVYATISPRTLRYYRLRTLLLIHLESKQERKAEIVPTELREVAELAGTKFLCIDHFISDTYIYTTHATRALQGRDLSGERLVPLSSARGYNVFSKKKKNNHKIRACKAFFRNNLDINDRPIRTVQNKRNKAAGTVIEPDLRGKHEKHRTLDPGTTKPFVYRKGNHMQAIRYFNESLPKSTIFRFFTPKKDKRVTCVTYENANDSEKELLKTKYDEHLQEKEMSRAEKRHDKENFEGVLAVYDLQAVMQLPKGDTSVFYYTSKLNVLNFTSYDLKTGFCECFVWDESNGHRGVNELGTCVYMYLEKKATTSDTDFMFYSYNCVGQQKNKFMLALYLYAVRYLGIKSITHKYLVKGHTQNEGDAVHSLIER
ncbi:hypothetical protein ANN_24370 [Periplaneta americana]|uniref:DUF7869 domain-containing protein n=1 Tax=Periplaneta americana TaxID=6978 RepID=A0ABQ8S2V4_PERAM|nr:hypothetical protein ANN_24370 [Periplaneta americana]